MSKFRLVDLQLLKRFLGERVSRLLWLGVLAGLVLFAVEIAFAYALQSFLIALGIASSVSIHLPSWVPSRSLGLITAFLLCLGVARGLLYWAQQYLPQATLEESGYHQRTRILHWAFQSKTVSSSETMTLFNEYNNGTAFALLAAENLVVGMTTALLLGATLFYLSPLLSIVVIALLALLLIPLRAMDKKVAESSKQIWTEWAKIYSTLLGSIKNLLLMQIYGTQNEEQAKAQRNLASYRRRLLKHYSVASLKFALPQIFGVVAICVIALTAGKLESISKGLLISYFYLLLRFVQCLALCAQHTSGLITYRIPFSKLFDWWKKHEPTILNGVRTDPAEFSLAAQAGVAPLAFEPVGAPIGWALEQVRFRYPGAATDTIAARDLTVAPGSALVILGPSGAGKSTLLNLILGQIEPSDGAIQVSYAGKQRGLTEALGAILPSIGYVGPDSFLIEGTLRTNLLYGLRFTPTEDEINLALEAAGCDFVRTLPAGLDHPLSEQGTGLSAGQKQRLSLARALLRRPSALILDEATSNLDAETEARLVRTLGSLKGRMTIVAVTHRLPLLELADQRLELV